MVPMTVKYPTIEELKVVGEEIGLQLSDADAESFHGLLGPMIEAYRALDEMPDNLPAVKYPREAGYRPSGEENRYNAWYYRTSVKGSAEGKLAGRRVVLKDNIMLAGVPMMCGSRILEGYVPEIDATVATRLLEAGAEIVGKATCECFCLSGGSHTSDSGPVLNPPRTGYSAGGSSSGCAALVAAGEVEMAIGGDQAGSIRMPSSFSGTYGMKATHGLVPYTGIMPVEVTIDHTGPITGTVKDNALLLEVIAGPDDYDPRQYNPIVHPYTEMIDDGIDGIKIGVLREGFGHSNSEPDVDSKVRAGSEILARLGADVRDISVPMHNEAEPICTAIGVAGVTETLLYGEGLGAGRRDLYVNSLRSHLRNLKERTEEMADTIKVFALLGTYIRNRHGNFYYGKGINLVPKLRRAYDTVLADCDLLLLPTTPMKATPLPGPDASREEVVQRAFETIANTSPFNSTHHPAMNVPCGMSDGLPIGMMLVGRHFDEPTIYRLAHAFEQAEDWMEL